MIILGAGMAGLLAGHMFRRHNPLILEAKPTLPNNHEALLRFRSSAVAEATGISFQSGEVRKAIVYKDQFAERVNPFLANMYSRKVLGEVRQRSIWNMEPATRYIAPPDFIKQMAGPLKIGPWRGSWQPRLAARLRQGPPGYLDHSNAGNDVMADWTEPPRFGALPIWSIQLNIIAPLVDVYQTIYYPDPEVAYYRASMTGDRLIIEFNSDPTNLSIHTLIDNILLDFGIHAPVFLDGDPAPKLHPLGKIAPVADDARKDFIYTMTREHNIYSLGRFATWRQILLDDVVNDCRVIDSLIAAEGKRSAYHQSLTIAKAS